MMIRSTQLKSGALVVALGLVLAAVSPAAAADKDDFELNVKARAVSTMNILRAASDLLDIRVTRWSTEKEREALAATLEAQGNHGLAAALNEQDSTGWVSFDPRGGGGPGRDPRRSTLRYSREIIEGDNREVILVTNHYPGYGTDPQAADGSKLAEYPVSFVLLKLQKNDDGEWTGVGRMFVGAKLRFDAAAKKFVIDEFPMDPVYLKDVKVR
jgi:hypothetical protein